MVGMSRVQYKKDVNTGVEQEKTTHHTCAVSAFFSLAFSLIIFVSLPPLRVFLYFCFRSLCVSNTVHYFSCSCVFGLFFFLLIQFLQRTVAAAVVDGLFGRVGAIASAAMTKCQIGTTDSVKNVAVF